MGKIDDYFKNLMREVITEVITDGEKPDQEVDGTADVEKPEQEVDGTSDEKKPEQEDNVLRETLLVGEGVSKEAFERGLAELRATLLNAQVAGKVEKPDTPVDAMAKLVGIYREEK